MTDNHPTQDNKFATIIIVAVVAALGASAYAIGVTGALKAAPGQLVPLALPVPRALMVLPVLPVPPALPGLPALQGLLARTGLPERPPAAVA